MNQLQARSLVGLARDGRPMRMTARASRPFALLMEVGPDRACVAHGRMKRQVGGLRPAGGKHPEIEAAAIAERRALGGIVDDGCGGIAAIPQQELIDMPPAAGFTGPGVDLRVPHRPPGHRTSASGQAREKSVCGNGAGHENPPHFPHDMNRGMETIFVYGTLRRGGLNHFRMDGAEFVMQGVVRGRLYGIDWYPGLVADESAGWVTGELYQVSAGHLAALDDFEGPEYTRAIVNAHHADTDGPPHHAWAWLWKGVTDESRRIPGGDWLAAG